MKRVNTIIEDEESVVEVKKELGLTWEELIVQGAEALREKYE